MSLIRAYNPNIKIGVVRDGSLGDTINVTVIATGFGSSFDLENAKRPHLSSKSVLNELITQPIVKPNILDIPTFQREKENLGMVGVVRLKREGKNVFIFDDEEDTEKYHIPTFMRKSVD